MAYHNGDNGDNADNADRGALLSLNLASNCLRADAAKALATALEGNQAITELNVASNELFRSESAKDMSGIIALANVIPGMGALSSFTFGEKQVVTMTAVMTDANFSGKLKSYEAQIVAAFLPKCT
jgi:hypothetical protein